MQCVFIQVPDIDRDGATEYVKQLIRMHSVMSVVRPGHPWFEVQMGNYQRAARTLRGRLWGASREEVEATVEYIRMESEARLREQLSADVRRGVQKSLVDGRLPLINTKATI